MLEAVTKWAEDSLNRGYNSPPVFGWLFEFVLMLLGAFALWNGRLEVGATFFSASTIICVIRRHEKDRRNDKR